MKEFEVRNTMTTQTETFVGRPAEVPEGGPRHLPHAAYPKAADVDQHGLQPLPESLPLVDFAQAGPYRGRYSAVVATDLTPTRLLQMAWAVGASFVRHEPQARHLQPPKHPPAGLMEARHTDPFGSASFGEWDAETLMYWLIRLSVLTDPTSPLGTIRVNEEILAQSLAIVGERSRIIGGAFNETMPPFDVEPPLREDDDPFLDTVVGVWEPVYAALGAQDAEALTALSERYPAFRGAYKKGKVGHHLLIARSDDLPKEDTFELVAASAEHYQALGHEYMVTEATNQWTGAAFEALGGVRVHFAPFQAEPAVQKSDEPLEGVATSPNGFLSDKDSGGMFYVLRLV